jgi:plasmid stabilization system protein ParE
VTVAQLRPLAENDLVERTQFYRAQEGDDLGERFFDAALAALRTVERMPDNGSLRIGEISDITGLRSHRISGFPCGWLYFTRTDHLDIVRLLAYAQDLPSLLAEE